ncbi:unnamed protein product [Phyllotreta striolata]|uniref:Tripartite motif-containing protein 45 n=1 Tax=Phyllotreta striolata TaxID=444603 RepID=A0A9N9TPE9_PHYSR|nr:unnamed protein product [Phyllotreta striolata]
MDTDRMSYIFGSFARRRQGQEQSGAKRRSIDSTKKPNDDRLSPNTAKKQMLTFQRTKTNFTTSLDDAKFRCPLCKNQYEDPRILPCLHTFCLKCLEQLEQTDFSVWNDDDDAQKTSSSSGSIKASSAGSGYTSDKPDDLSPGKCFFCPSCGSSADLPIEGVGGFLPNYPLLHKMLSANVNPSNYNHLCDVCTSDKSITFRCIDCSINLCDVCEENHHKQNPSQKHKIATLGEAAKQPLMCLRHPDMELVLFCSSCSQVICKDCLSNAHRDHSCEPVSKAIKYHQAKLKSLADRARNAVEDSAVASSKINSLSKTVESQCNSVQSEVEQFIEEYIQSVEHHKSGLLEQIKEVKEEKLRSIGEEKEKVQKRLRDARDVAYFLSDLLAATDAEMLVYLPLVAEKMAKCGDPPGTDLKVSGSLHFLKEETVKCPNDFYTVYGVLTTQSVSPENCFLNTTVLQNLRVGKKVEVLLETRDHDDVPIERGGEEVSSNILHWEGGVSKSLIVNVKDKRNGMYVISFTPDVPGKLILNVNIKGQPVKGSPFPVNVRTIKQHIGLYHCCTFCSSKGNKEAVCGCAGEMPGGYKGCGHGHEGHPGRRHWSCCGSILEHSECTGFKQFASNGN